MSAKLILITHPLATRLWVRSRNCGCLVTWFCYQLIAKPGNKTAAVSWPDPYIDAKIYNPHVSFQYEKSGMFALQWPDCLKENTCSLGGARREITCWHQAEDSDVWCQQVISRLAPPNEHVFSCYTVLLLLLWRRSEIFRSAFLLRDPACSTRWWWIM